MQGLRASRLPLPSLRMQAGILACSGDLRCYEIAPRSSRSFMLWRVCLPHMRDYWVDSPVAAAPGIQVKRRTSRPV